MMNIAIIAENSHYRSSLKTAINQIDDLNVVFDAEDFDIPAKTDFSQIQILIMDFKYYKSYKILALRYPQVKIYILCDDAESYILENVLIDIPVKNHISKMSNKSELANILKLN